MCPFDDCLHGRARSKAAESRVKVVVALFTKVASRLLTIGRGADTYNHSFGLFARSVTGLVALIGGAVAQQASVVMLRSGKRAVSAP
jgi:hypothetical protein